MYSHTQNFIILLGGILLITFIFSGSSPATYQVVFNIPLLMEKETGQLLAALGEPISTSSYSPIQSEEETLQTMVFQKKGYQLSVDISSLTGKVQTAFLTTMSGHVEPGGLTRLREAGNIDALPPHLYASMEPSKQGSNGYSGLHVQVLQPGISIPKE